MPRGQAWEMNEHGYQEQDNNEMPPDIIVGYG